MLRSSDQHQGMLVSHPTIGSHQLSLMFSLAASFLASQMLGHHANEQQSQLVDGVNTCAKLLDTSHNAWLLII